MTIHVLYNESKNDRSGMAAFEYFCMQALASGHDIDFQQADWPDFETVYANWVKQSKKPDVIITDTYIPGSKDLVQRLLDLQRVQGQFFPHSHLPPVILLTGEGYLTLQNVCDEINARTDLHFPTIYLCQKPFPYEDLYEFISDIVNGVPIASAGPDTAFLYKPDTIYDDAALEPPSSKIAAENDATSTGENVLAQPTPLPGKAMTIHVLYNESEDELSGVASLQGFRFSAQYGGYDIDFQQADWLDFEEVYAKWATAGQKPDVIVADNYIPCSKSLDARLADLQRIHGQFFPEDPLPPVVLFSAEPHHVLEAISKKLTARHDLHFPVIVPCEKPVGDEEFFALLDDLANGLLNGKPFVPAKFVPDAEPNHDPQEDVPADSILSPGNAPTIHVLYNESENDRSGMESLRAFRLLAKTLGEDIDFQQADWRDFARVYNDWRQNGQTPSVIVTDYYIPQSKTLPERLLDIQRIHHQVFPQSPLPPVILLSGTDYSALEALCSRLSAQSNLHFPAIVPCQQPVNGREFFSLLHDLANGMLHGKPLVTASAHPPVHLEDILHTYVTLRDSALALPVEIGTGHAEENNFITAVGRVDPADMLSPYQAQIHIPEDQTEDRAWTFTEATGSAAVGVYCGPEDDPLAVAHNFPEMKIVLGLNDGQTEGLERLVASTPSSRAGAIIVGPSAEHAKQILGSLGVSSLLIGPKEAKSAGLGWEEGELVLRHQGAKPKPLRTGDIVTLDTTHRRLYPFAAEIVAPEPPSHAYDSFVTFLAANTDIFALPKFSFQISGPDDRTRMPAHGQIGLFRTENAFLTRKGQACLRAAITAPSERTLKAFDEHLRAHLEATMKASTASLYNPVFRLLDVKPDQVFSEEKDALRFAEHIGLSSLRGAALAEITPELYDLQVKAICDIVRDRLEDYSSIVFVPPRTESAEQWKRLWGIIASSLCNPTVGAMIETRQGEDNLRAILSAMDNGRTQPHILIGSSDFASDLTGVARNDALGKLDWQGAHGWNGDPFRTLFPDLRASLANIVAITHEVARFASISLCGEHAAVWQNWRDLKQLGLDRLCIPADPVTFAGGRNAFLLQEFQNTPHAIRGCFDIRSTFTWEQVRVLEENHRRTQAAVPQTKRRLPQRHSVDGTAQP